MILGSALLVISSKNPVNSVIFLIFSFFNSAAIFLIAGAEFLALIMLIVYVGAVAVFFLFVSRYVLIIHASNQHTSLQKQQSHSKIHLMKNL